jgi:hypothetical protein
MPIFRWGKRTVPWSGILILGMWQNQWYMTHRFAKLDLTMKFAVSKFGVHQLWMPFAEHHSADGYLLLYLILGAQVFQASDERDKLFALLGLCKEVNDWENLYPGLKLDYMVSAPKAYADFARHMIYKTKRLNVLAAAGRFKCSRERGNLSRYPSWVPEVFRNYYTQIIAPLSMLCYKRQVAEYNYAELSDSTHWRVLRLQGRVLGRA